MKNTMPSVMKPILGVSLAGASLTVSATGFRAPDQDAFATARGEAFVATADNASAIYYNPAGLTQVDGQEVRGGVYGLYVRPRFTSPTGQEFENEKTWHAIPQLFYSYKPETLPLAFGLGLYTPYGLSSRWAQDTGFRTVATEGSITCYTINPTVAWEIAPSFSVGAGIRVNYADTDLRNGIVWPNQPNDEFRFKGDGWAVSYDLGVLWKVHEKVSLGATFKSQTDFTMDGHTESFNNVAFPPGVPPQFQFPAFPTQRQSASAGFQFPMNAVFGVSYRPTTNWNFEFNADYTDWSSLGTVTIQQANGQNLPLALNWHGSWYYEFGATRYLAHGWSVSAGYIFNQNSVPDATYTPLVADLDRHFLSVGAGYKGKHFTIDAAYQFGYGPARTVAGSAPSIIGQTADGKYDFLSHAIFLTAGWHF
jgi:long-chain fatty acid transport protein